MRCSDRGDSGASRLHKEIEQIVAGIVAKRKFALAVHQCAASREEAASVQALALLFFSIHLDGLRAAPRRAVCQQGVFDRAISAIRAAKAAGFQVNANATDFRWPCARGIAAFLDFTTELGVNVSISPGLCL